MANVGTLSVAVSAKTKKFKKGMKNANKTLQRFSHQAKIAAARGAAIGSAFVATAIAGISFMVKKELEAIDATAKLSDRIGIATEDLQRLRFAAKITGANSETLDKSMEQLSKRLGEAAQGLGTGKDGLKALGIELQDIIDKGPAEQFKLIADAVAKLGTQEERVAVATQLFGRSGVSLVNTLALGRKGIEGLGQEADKLGISFSRIDAAKVEAANDAMTRLGGLIEGAAASLTIAVAPMLELVIQKVVKWGTEGEGASKKVLKGFRFVLMALAKVADFFSLLEAGWLTFVSGFQTGASALLKGLAVVIEGYEKLAEVTGVGQGNSISNQVRNQASVLSANAMDNAQDAMIAFDKFANGSAQHSVNRFFANLNEKSEAAAKEAVRLQNLYKNAGDKAKTLKNIEKLNKKGARNAASSREVILSRISVSGFSRSRNREQKVFDPQLSRTNALLDNIKRKIGGPANFGVAQ